MNRRRRLAVVDHDRPAEAEKPATAASCGRTRARAGQVRDRADKEAGPARPRDRDAGQGRAACHGIISFRTGTRPAESSRVGSRRRC
jgi:hypothetical protein